MANGREKIEVTARVPVETKDDLSLAYTPGVAQPCLEIQKDINKSYELTRRWNLCAVITDGSAVLGLGDIGPEAGMPVMEGKCVLFKAFGDVDAFPLCVRTHDVDEFVNTVALISGSFGGVNLEDISAPRCFEIERKLKERCDIPIFHDDQHGTAVITLAGLTNALKVVGKKKEDVRIVTSGAGAAAIAIVKLLLSAGFKNVTMCDRKGAIYKGRDGLNWIKEELAEVTNLEHKAGSLADILVGADVFIGVSAPGTVTTEMVKTMNRGRHRLRLREPDAGDLSGGCKGGRRKGRLDRPKRLPEPDQQRSGLPRHLPRRVRRARRRHQRGDEGRRRARAGRAHLRRGAFGGLYHPQSLRPPRRPSRRKGRCGGREKNRRGICRCRTPDNSLTAPQSRLCRRTACFYNSIRASPAHADSTAPPGCKPIIFCFWKKDGKHILKSIPGLAYNNEKGGFIQIGGSAYLRSGFCAICASRSVGRNRNLGNLYETGGRKDGAV